MGFINWFLTKLSQSISSIYFRKIHVIGTENIPDDGPIIFCGNHSNQFIDPIMIMSTVTKRNLSFTIAASSFTKPIVGQIARLTNAIPVVRPEDSKIKGDGKIFIIDNKMTGINTKFLDLTDKLGAGWSIFINAKTIQIRKIIDNENLEIVKTPDTELMNNQELNYFVSYFLNKFII
jgi:glycerol-3-phosphate O-acyltransferase/dihydroxyacetone phosphate acyltransferase